MAKSDNIRNFYVGIKEIKKGYHHRIWYTW